MPMSNPCASFGGGLGGYGGGFGSFGGGGLGAYGSGMGGGGGFGGICGVPIGFGVTTTVGGIDPYTDDLYGGGLGYGSTLGYGAAGVPRPGVGGVGGAFNRALNRGPYRRPF